MCPLPASIANGLIKGSKGPADEMGRPASYQVRLTGVNGRLEIPGREDRVERARAGSGKPACRRGYWRLGAHSSGFRGSRERPGVLLLQQVRDKGDMHRVTGSFGDDVPEERVPHQRQVTNNVQDLVPAEFVRKTQPPRVHQPLARQDDRVLERAAAHQATRAKLLNLFHKPESPRRGYFLVIVTVAQGEIERLFAD